MQQKKEYHGTAHYLFMDFKKACDSVRMEVVYNILNEYDLPMKLDRLITMCLNETYSKVCIDICLIHCLFRLVWNKKRCFITTAF
jgi:hypothetical protein